MTVPTSNKPAEDVKKKDIMQDTSFQQKVTATISEIKQAVGTVEVESTKVEALKIVSLYNVGKQMNELLEQVGDKEKKLIVERFHKEIGMDKSFFYLAMQANEYFSKEEFEQMRKNGITLQVFKALTGIKDEKLRKKAMERAINEGLSADEIRKIKGTKGARKEAYSKKKAETDKKKPPVRIFSQGLDRVHMVDEAVKSCTDAVSRLSECKTDDERTEAVKVLIEVRKVLPDLIAEMQSFLKFTNSFSKQK